MATDHIRYDLLVQDAFRGIFRKVLTDAATQGLPGEHHFYITFKTHAPGVVLSDRLRAEYPEQMTIILQHQFWDLRVHDAGFEVGLSFRRIPEKLEIPFAAVTGFFDPSVNFGAEFTADEDGVEGGADGPVAFDTKKAGPALATLGGVATPAGVPSDFGTFDAARDARTTPSPAAQTIKVDGAKVEPGKVDAGKRDAAEPATRKTRGANSEPATVPAADEDNSADTSKVVSIDAFRKKNT